MNDGKRDVAMASFDGTMFARIASYHSKFSSYSLAIIIVTSQGDGSMSARIAIAISVLTVWQL